MRQLTLIDPPPLAPAMPPPGLVAQCLNLLLTGERITHPDFEAQTGSWRLAAYVADLRRMGWPVESETLTAGEHRNVARYRLAPDALQMLQEATKCN